MANIVRLGGGGGGNPYDQLLNYLMLYDQGNECAAVTGGWNATGTYTAQDGGVLTKNAGNMTIVGSGNYNKEVASANTIDVTNYAKLCQIVKCTGDSNSTFNFAYRSTRNSGTGTSYAFVSGVGIIANKSLQAIDVSAISSLGYVSDYLTRQLSQTGNATLTIYAVFVVKEDLWEEWMSVGGVTGFSTMEAILANSTAMTTLMGDRDAVNYMVARCTGTVMAAAITSSTFLAAYNASPYKAVIDANEHWAKFLSMLA